MRWFSRKCFTSYATSWRRPQTSARIMPLSDSVARAFDSTGTPQRSDWIEWSPAFAIVVNYPTISSRDARAMMDLKEMTVRPDWADRMIIFIIFQSPTQTHSESDFESPKSDFAKSRVGVDEPANRLWYIPPHECVFIDLSKGRVMVLVSCVTSLVNGRCSSIRRVYFDFTHETWTDKGRKRYKGAIGKRDG